MRSVNIIAMIIFVVGIIAFGFGVVVQKTLNMDDGISILSSIGAMFVGILMVGVAEIIRLLYKISRQLDKSNTCQDERVYQQR